MRNSNAGNSFQLACVLVELHLKKLLLQERISVMSVSDALRNIRRLEQRGAYREAAALADTLPSEIIQRPTIALERARVPGKIQAR